MINRTITEYDTIKVLREISIMRKLNKICASFEYDGVPVDKGLFVPELIDIITPTK